MDAWVLPEEPRPVRLMNTVWADRAGVHDDLSTPTALAAWLQGVGLPVGHSTDNALERAVLLRDSARALAAVRTRDIRVRAAAALTLEQALDALNSALTASPAPRLAVRNGRVLYERAPAAATTNAAVATLAAEAAELLGDATVHLRACDAPGCVLYFVKDHPRRAWCRPGCGNRARAARHYAKHKHPSDAS